MRISSCYVGCRAHKTTQKTHLGMPFCPCHIISLDIVDVTSVHLTDFGGKLHRRRIDQNGALIDLSYSVTNL